MKELVLVWSFGWFLYEVERETERGIYGRKPDGVPYPGFVSLADVRKRNATEHDLERVVSAQAEKDRRVRAAHDAYRKAIAAICGDER